ncbi:hypothetical protein Btru_056180 [Bulinus truncatus]|nr:hypothetical protein Btru_056180 [Bulinus truncatus]
MTLAAGHFIFTVVIFEVLSSNYEVIGQSVPLNSSIQVNSSFPARPEGRITALCPEGWLPASAARPGYDLSRNQLCVKLNEPRRRWEDALGQCRSARGFMVKLDSILMLRDTSLLDYLRQKG